MAMLEQSRRREEQREDTLKSLARERMEQANMGSEDRVETKRFLRRMQQENKEREMEEAILNVSWILQGFVTYNMQRAQRVSQHVQHSYYKCISQNISVILGKCYFILYFLYARLKNGRIMPWQCPSVRLSVRPSGFSGLFFNMLWDINLKLGIYIQ